MQWLENWGVWCSLCNRNAFFPPSKSKTKQNQKQTQPPKQNFIFSYATRYEKVSSYRHQFNVEWRRANMSEVQSSFKTAASKRKEEGMSAICFSLSRNQNLSQRWSNWLLIAQNCGTSHLSPKDNWKNESTCETKYIFLLQEARYGVVGLAIGLAKQLECSEFKEMHVSVGQQERAVSIVALAQGLSHWTWQIFKFLYLAT